MIKSNSPAKTKELCENENDTLDQVARVGREMFDGHFKFVIDAVNEPIFRKLIQYFQRSPLFIDDDPTVMISPNRSFTKGILLIGNVGTGKDITLLLFERLLRMWNHPDQFRYVTAKRVTTMYEIGGAEAVEKFGYESFLMSPAGPVVDRPVSYAFGDLGAEPNVARFGNFRALMIDVLESRYDLRFSGLKTFGTTNMDRDRIRDRYNARTLDRIPEMFNQIEVPGKSRRK